MRNSIMILAITVSVFIMSCAGNESGDVIVIREKMFLAQINDVYLNMDDYLGKTIKLEGIFMKSQYYDDAFPYCYVIRYGPGCCGDDGDVGFEVRWIDNQAQPYPANDSWVEATGVLKLFSEDIFSQYLYLDLISLNVLKKRGVENVRQ